MRVCSKCSHENPDKSSFCNNCGNELKSKINTIEVPNTEEMDTGNDVEKLESNSVNVENTDKSTPVSIKKISKNQIIGAFIVIFAITLCVSVVLMLTNPIAKLESAIKSGDTVAAIAIYKDDLIKDNEKQNEADEYLVKTSDSILTDYIDGKISYEDAKKKLETIIGIGIQIPRLDEKIKSLDDNHASKEAFINAEALLKEKNLPGALKEYSKVISSDQNYAKAQDNIKKNINVYQKIIFEEADKLVSQKKYDEAVLVVNNAETLLNKAVIESKITAINDAHEQYLIKNQKMSVVGISFFYDILDQKYVEVKVKNNTNKVVKKYTVGFLSYDKAGYPVKMGWISEDYFKEAEAEGKNIQAWEQGGTGWGWQLAGPDGGGDIAKIIACVKFVEYYDGTSWTNEYFDIWKEKYLQKPLL